MAFFVIGAQKAGTTTLWRLLKQHPQLRFPASKEAPFLADPAYDGDAERCVEAEFGPAPDGILGAASPQYMMGAPGAPVPLIVERMAAAFPDVRLIALLRDPVERAVSQWRMSRRWGHDERPLQDALAAQLEPAALEEARTSPTTTNSYVVQGEYGRVLGVYLQRFPRDRLLVELTADLDRDPAGVLERVLAHLGLDPAWRPADVRERWLVGGERRVSKDAEDELLQLFYREVAPHAGEAAPAVAAAFWQVLNHWNVVPEEPPPVPEPLAARLRDHYARDAARLERLLGLDVPWSAAVTQP